MAVMVTRIRKTLAVQQRSAAFERTNKIVADAAKEERHLREESERLCKLRLAALNARE